MFQEICLNWPPYLIIRRTWDQTFRTVMSYWACVFCFCKIPKFHNPNDVSFSFKIEKTNCFLFSDVWKLHEITRSYLFYHFKEISFFKEILIWFMETLILHLIYYVFLNIARTELYLVFSSSSTLDNFKFNAQISTSISCHTCWTRVGTWPPSGWHHPRRHTGEYEDVCFPRNSIYGCDGVSKSHGKMEPYCTCVILLCKTEPYCTCAILLCKMELY